MVAVETTNTMRKEPFPGVASPPRIPESRALAEHKMADGEDKEDIAISL